jgi:alpha-D-ribose 1-methylphosphonate 5-triphosphate synthase subunit PhnG
MAAVAIARTTGIHALLLSGRSGGEGTRRIIGVARMERSSAQWQKHREQEGHNRK